MTYRFLHYLIASIFLFNVALAQKDKDADLFEAVVNRNIPEIKRLIAKGANVDVKVDGGITPLIISAYAGYTDVVDILLEVGADPNIVNDDNEPPLITSAASEKADEIVPMLLEAGAEVDLRDRFGRTAFIVQAQMGRLGAVQSLFEAGTLLEAEDMDGQTAVFAAAMNGHTEVLQFLIEQGGSIEVKSNFDVTPLMVAASEGYTETVKLLLDKGSDPYVQGVEKRTALDFAVLSGSWETVEVFLKTGTPVQGEMWKFGSALIVAIWADQSAFVPNLIDKGAEVNRLFHDISPLMMAAIHNDIASANYLLGAGADVNLQSSEGGSALLIAAYAGQLEFVKFLVENGANIYQENYQGGTVLRSAADQGHVEIVQYFLDLGLSPNTLDDFGMYPIDYARQNGYTKVVKLLEHY